jgi:hypothetical protein
MKLVAKALFWVGLALALPFVVLFGASIMRMTTEGIQSQYVNSAFLGLFCAAFSVAVGYMLRQMLLERID